MTSSENGAYLGSCLCGEISFSVDAFPKSASHCHCSMCRKFHGAAFATLVKVEGLQWLSGEACLNHYTAANGTVRTFCQCCGSSLAFRSTENSPMEIAIANFSYPIPVQVNAHIYTNYSASWMKIEDGLPQFGEGSKEN